MHAGGDNKHVFATKTAAAPIANMAHARATRSKRKNKHKSTPTAAAKHQSHLQYSNYTDGSGPES